MKKLIRINVYSASSYQDSVPRDPVGFLRWWQDVFDLVPEEFRSTTQVDCDCDISYDVAYATATVSYTRLETDEEEAARLKKEELNRSLIEERELCQLENLRKKYSV